MVNLSLKSLPKNSVILCGLAALTSVALTFWLSIRPLSLGFLLLFTYWFYKTRCNVCIEMSPEFHLRCQKTLDQLRNWKETKPAAFCAFATICLATLAIIGHFISGSVVVIIGLAFAAILSTKYNLQLVKKESAEIANLSDKTIKEYEVEDEFMPEVNETNFIVLENAAESWSSKSYGQIESTNDAETGEESDEVPSELSLPLDKLPEIHDIENSSEDDDQNDLLALHSVDLSKYPIEQDNGTVSGSGKSNESGMQLIDDGIQFKKGYFKRDSSLSTESTTTSSSSSEESLSKGLQFPDLTTATSSSSQQQNESAAQVEALLSQSAKLLLPGFMSEIMHGLLGASPNSKTSLPDKPDHVIKQERGKLASNKNKLAIENTSSSDESDFELIDNSDLN